MSQSGQTEKTWSRGTFPKCLPNGFSNSSRRFQSICSNIQTLEASFPSAEVSFDSTESDWAKTEKQVYIQTEHKGSFHFLPLPNGFRKIFYFLSDRVDKSGWHIITFFGMKLKFCMSEQNKVPTVKYNVIIIIIHFICKALFKQNYKQNSQPHQKNYKRKTLKYIELNIKKIHKISIKQDIK